MFKGENKISITCKKKETWSKKSKIIKFLKFTFVTWLFLQILNLYFFYISDSLERISLRAPRNTGSRGMHIIQKFHFSFTSNNPKSTASLCKGIKHLNARQWIYNLNNCFRSIYKTAFAVNCSLCASFRALN